MRFDHYSNGVLWTCIGVLGATSLVAQLALLERQPSVQVDIAPPIYIALPAGEDWMREHDIFVPVEVPTASSQGPAPIAAAEPSITDLFVDAIIQIESGGKPDVVGKAGERGLMQIKRETWREVTQGLFGRPVSFSRAFEPELNRTVGQAYLRMLCRFLYENQPEWKSDMRSLLLACYNAGPSHVRDIGFDTRRLSESTKSYVERAMSVHDFLLTSASDLTADAAEPTDLPVF